MLTAYQENSNYVKAEEAYKIQMEELLIIPISPNDCVLPLAPSYA